MANHSMNPRISVITLGVNDLGTSLAFYRDGLGLQTTGIIGTEFKGDETHPSGAIVMFELQNGVILALYPRCAGYIAYPFQNQELTNHERNLHVI